MTNVMKVEVGRHCDCEGSRALLLLLDVATERRSHEPVTIRPFRRNDTSTKFLAQRVARCRDIEAVATRKLAMLDRVGRAEELRVPPNNELEQLKGERKGQWSIRQDDQWLVCSRFADGHAADDEIVDRQETE